MKWPFMLPLALQGILIFIDEVFFHRRRRLPAWEVWGHPLDTLSVALPFGVLAFFPESLFLYVGLCVFSCLFVTKDEFIHLKHCVPMEHWLHSLLFLIHPVSFFAAWHLSRMTEGSSIIKTQFFLILGFMLYQILYWGRPWRAQA